MTFAGLTNPIVQAYKYDSLYRLKEAKETANGNPNWFQNFSYDQYGNRLSFVQNIAGAATNFTPTVSASTNRFNPNQGFAYDKNGNVVNDVDAATSLTRQFVFNGDNKQSEVKKDGVTIGRYFYDGEGKRVKKITDTETTVFVYSSGKLIAEYSTQLTTQPSTNYTTTDHLGTPRIITDELGQVKARRDFMPFGEELYINVGARSTNLDYGTSEDQVRQKFTGYQKDSETGLDFAEARMYESLHGRFTAVDPLLVSGKSANPQTFNRYVYVGNNPIARVDRTGLDWLYTITRGNDGKKVYNPTWTPGKFPDGTVPRGFDGKWSDVRNLVYQVSVGENSGSWAALDPNSDRSFMGTEAEARRQYDVFTGKATSFDAKMAKSVEDVDAKPLANAVLDSPLTKPLNADAISVGGNVPGLRVGGTLTVTRHFDTFLSVDKGIFDFKNFASSSSNFAPSGGLSFQFSYMDQMNPTPRDTLQFYEGGAVTVGGCSFRVCGGQTTSMSSGRSAINAGFTLSPVPSGEVTISNAFNLNFNPHRRFFGPTPLNGGQ